MTKLKYVENWLSSLSTARSLSLDDVPMFISLGKHGKQVSDYLEYFHLRKLRY